MFRRHQQIQIESKTQVFTSIESSAMDGSGLDFGIMKATDEIDPKPSVSSQRLEEKSKVSKIDNLFSDEFNESGPSNIPAGEIKSSILPIDNDPWAIASTSISNDSPVTDTKSHPTSSNSDQEWANFDNMSS